MQNELLALAERCEAKAAEFIGDFVKSPGFGGGYLETGNALLQTAANLRSAAALRAKASGAEHG